MKILIAEDDLNIRMGLSDLLDNEGYTCLEAENGEAALRDRKSTRLNSSHN